MSDQDKEAVTQRYRPDDDPREQGVTQIYTGEAANEVIPPAQVDNTQTAAQTHTRDDSVTRLYQPSGDAVHDAIVVLAVDQLVADRYRIRSAPLNRGGGEAQIYQCLDLQTERTMVLKHYHQHATPNEDVLQGLKGLVHENIVGITDYGAWGGRFFEVMEYCPGGSMAEHAPYSENQLCALLPKIINGLQYCHTRGIVHRDIKPSNIFFRDRQGTSPVLADFGISSYAPQSRERVTQSAANLTLDYVAPETLDGHLVGPKSDYYSLGVTLIHLLMGHSPLRGMPATDVIVAHLNSRIPYPVCSDHFRRLLSGLLQKNVNHRWGFRQVVAWMEGETVLTDSGHAWQDLGQAFGEPYPGYQNATNLRELAESLDCFDAETQLFRGDIRQWLFEYVDEKLAARVALIEKDYNNRRALGVIKLRYVLCPNLPLLVHNKEISGLHQLVQILSTRNYREQIALKDLLFNGTLAVWAEVKSDIPDRHEFVSRVLDIVERLKRKQHSLALFAMLYTIDPGRPLPLAKDVALTEPADMEKVLCRRSDLGEKMLQMIFSERIDEWIRACRFDGWDALVSWLGYLRRNHNRDRELFKYCIRWRFNPATALPFLGHSVASPKAFAALVNQNRLHFREAVKLLKSGWIREWLVQSGRMPNPLKFDHLVWEKRLSWRHKLEAVLRTFDPVMAAPVISVRPAFLNVRIREGGSVTRKIVIDNQGPSTLSGSIRVSDADSGVFPSRYEFDDNYQEVEIQIDSRHCSEGRHESVLEIDSNGGSMRIPVRYTVISKKSRINYLGLLLIGAIVIATLAVVSIFR